MTNKEKSFFKKELRLTRSAAPKRTSHRNCEVFRLAPSIKTKFYRRDKSKEIEIKYKIKYLIKCKKRCVHICKIDSVNTIEITKNIIYYTLKVIL